MRAGVAIVAVTFDALVISHEIRCVTVTAILVPILLALLARHPVCALACDALLSLSPRRFLAGTAVPRRGPARDHAHCVQKTIVVTGRTILFSILLAVSARRAIAAFTTVASSLRPDVLVVAIVTSFTIFSSVFSATPSCHPMRAVALYAIAVTVKVTFVTSAAIVLTILCATLAWYTMWALTLYTEAIMHEIVLVTIATHMPLLLCARVVWNPI